MDISSFLKQKNTIPSSGSWPETWKTVSYKIYERCKKLTLTTTKTIGNLGGLLLKRRSADSFTGKTMTSENLLTLFRYAAGTQDPDSFHRTYASGGALYPIELYYINLLESEDMAQGIYHFNPKDNSLSLIATKVFTQPGREIIGSAYESINRASGFICFTAVPSRVVDKYGWLGLRLCFIDIGQILQSIGLISQELDMSYRAIAGFSNDKVDALLQIDGTTELSLLVCAVGTN